MKTLAAIHVLPLTPRTTLLPERALERVRFSLEPGSGDARPPVVADDCREVGCFAF